MSVKENMRLRPVDFGGWVKRKIAESQVSASALSKKSGMLYPSLLRLLNGGATGKPVRPDYETATSIGEALVELEVIRDVGEAYVAAGYVVPGYRIVREEDIDAPAPTTEEMVEAAIKLLDPLNEKLARLNETQRKAVDALLDTMVAGGDTRA